MPSRKGSSQESSCASASGVNIRPVGQITASQRADELGARHQIAAVVIPGQRLETHEPHAVEHGGRAGRARRIGQRLLLDQQLAQPHGSAGDHGFAALVPGELIASLDLVGKGLEQLLLVQRDGEAHARFALAVIEIDGDDEILSRHRLCALEYRAAAIRELIATLAAWTLAADPIRVGQCQQHGGALEIGAESCCALPSSFRNDRCARRTRSTAPRSSIRAALAQQLESRAQVAVTSLPRATGAQQIAIGEYRGELRGQRRRSRAPPTSASCAPAADAPEIPASRGRAA